MGLFSFSDKELADKAIEAARVARNEGRDVFVYTLATGIGAKNDAGNLLTLVTSGIVGLGWKLHSLTPYINTIGPNTEEVLLTFERAKGVVIGGAADRQGGG